ncbi:hypothetical protein F5Y04DRAFT_287555 [Hypomontagnella monticulosa]|nr:hypothetical protein F5Y04DRAFT_287555 [Hypomontagnella monticulosa]
MAVQEAPDNVEDERIVNNDGATSQLQKPLTESSAGESSSKGSQSQCLVQHSEPEAEKSRPRDYITGREIADDGATCLRCAEKGLRCTLNFKGVRGEDKCAACRRSGTEHCIRQLPPDERAPFEGPPWRSPNFFTIGTVLDPKDMEERLHEFFLGNKTYAFGTYQYEEDRKLLALPAFNGSDLPLEERRENWQSMEWRDVLPIWQNRSLRPKPWKWDDEYDENDPFVSEDTLQYLRFMRRYIPREAHMKERMADEGKKW